MSAAAAAGGKGSSSASGGARAGAIAIPERHSCQTGPHRRLSLPSSGFCNRHSEDFLALAGTASSGQSFDEAVEAAGVSLHSDWLGWSGRPWAACYSVRIADLSFNHYRSSRLRICACSRVPMIPLLRRHWVP